MNQFNADTDPRRLENQLAPLHEISAGSMEARHPHAAISSVSAITASSADWSSTALRRRHIAEAVLYVLPASTASAERSFSSLRRLKSYLRSTMAQKRLTALMAIHVHKSRCDELL